MYNFFTSIEFYVIACVVAAAIVVFSAMPKQTGEARQFLLGGYLCFDTDDEEGDGDSPKISDSTSNSETQPKTDIQLEPQTLSKTDIQLEPQTLSKTDIQSKKHIQSNTNTPSHRNTVSEANPSSDEIKLPSNVSLTSDIYPPQSQPSAQEPSIVEVTETGYREIPSGQGKKKGKKRNQSQPAQNLPTWITGTADGKEPEIDLLCLEEGTVKLIRKGLNGMVTADGAVSLACNLIGFDLHIEERLVFGGRNLKDPVPTEAVFSLEFLAPNEHYHIHYNSETIHRMTAFTLATKDGMHIVKTLT